MVNELIDGTVLFHGSYAEVVKPDLRCCRRNKDFGRGFYLTTDKTQAENFARLSTKKAVANHTIDASQNFGYISAFQYHADQTLHQKIYPSSDTEWLHCIVAHRKPQAFSELAQTLEIYDIIGGKIANDATNATLVAYMAGTFGNIESESAGRICISLLLPERLKDQYCFRTNQALATLTFMESYKIWK